MRSLSDSPLPELGEGPGVKTSPAGGEDLTIIG